MRRSAHAHRDPPARGFVLDTRLESAGIEVEGASRSLVTTAGSRPLQRGAALRVPLRERAHRQERHADRHDRRGDLGELLAPGSRRVPRRHQVAGLSLRDEVRVSRFRSTTSSRRRRRPRSSSKYEEQAAKVETNYRRGVIVDDERRQQEIEIWTNANKEVGDATDRAMNAIVRQPDPPDGRLRRAW